MSANDNSKSELVWEYPKPDEKFCAEIVSEFSIHPVVAEILASRGFKNKGDINLFLYARLPNLHDPTLMKGISKATSRIYQAQKNNEPIVIYGDNDVDGMTSTALLTDFFNSAGIKVYYYVPKRNLSKYSSLTDALDFVKMKKARLMITVDCGISSRDEVAKLKREGIDVIITDHHEPPEDLPDAVAILNPKLANNKYPNRHLVGAGVAFKLAHAYTNFLISKGIIASSMIDLKNYLDLVALGTVADMGSLSDENRVLVRYGLLQLQNTKRVGLLKLMKMCNIKKAYITTMDISTKLGPRLNSLGRIDDPTKGVEILLVKDPIAADCLAKELELTNSERQTIEKAATSEIEAQLVKHPELLNEKAIVLCNPNMHGGIIPILANRIAKKYNRPTAILSVGPEYAKGSIRTIKEYPVLDPLRSMHEMFVTYGGHDYAAGCTMRRDQIDNFTKRFIELANDKLKDQDITPKLNLDAKVSFRDMTFDFLESLSLMEPHGMDNPPVTLYCEVKQVWPPKVINRKHLKLYLEEGNLFLEGIAFNQADRKKSLSHENLRIVIAFTPSLNVHNQKSSIQLLIRDFLVLNAPDSPPKKSYPSSARLNIEDVF
ncbi:MAG: Single-stranded-DNA-specific exonuclease RecJ [Chlamydiia bacterium]|nr:Single-stranded-DNA-specific exonuclease RecJ [Chlamydiia bacterium]